MLLPWLPMLSCVAAAAAAVLQGRARPSIAALYNWRYGGLKDLPAVTQVGHTDTYIQTYILK
jgi:hypothetical protein